MPAQRAWFHRLDEILSALRSMTSTHLDRAAVEKLFRVRQRRARQIMAGLEGLRVGNAAAVSREALIARHCHVNRVEPQRPAWIPFQAAALAVSHTLNASFRNRLNVSLLHK